MKRRRFILLVLLWTTPLLGQTWLRALGGEGDQRANAVLPAAEGGYTLVGHAAPAGEESGDLWIAHADSSGRLEWSRSLGTAKAAKEGYSLVQLPNQDYLVAGQGKRGSRLTGRLLRFNPQGDTIWTRNLDSLVIKSLSLQQGRILACGNRTLPRGGAWLGCLDEQGALLWGHSFNPKDSSHVEAFTPLSDSTFALAGSGGLSKEGNVRAWCAVVSESGRVLRQRLYDRAGSQFRCVVAREGEIVCGGGAVIPRVPWSRRWEFLVARTRLADGWVDSLCWGGEGLSMVNSLCWADSRIVGTGYSVRDVLNAFPAATLFALDARLSELWTTKYGGEQMDWGKCILPLPDGFLVAGLTRSFGAGDAEALLLRTNSRGGVLERSFDYPPLRPED